MTSNHCFPSWLQQLYFSEFYFWKSVCWFSFYLYAVSWVLLLLRLSLYKLMCRFEWVVCSYPAVIAAEGKRLTGCSCEPVRWDQACGRSCRWGHLQVVLASAAAAWPAEMAPLRSLYLTQQIKVHVFIHWLILMYSNNYTTWQDINFQHIHTERKLAIWRSQRLNFMLLSNTSWI